jgi:hypothetical protein
MQATCGGGCGGYQSFGGIPTSKQRRHLRRWKHLRGVARPEPVRIQLTVSVGGVCYPFAPCRRLPLRLVRIGEKGGAGMARRTAVPYRHSASVCTRGSPRRLSCRSLWREGLRSPKGAAPRSPARRMTTAGSESDPVLTPPAGIRWTAISRTITFLQ